MFECYASRRLEQIRDPTGAPAVTRNGRFMMVTVRYLPTQLALCTAVGCGLHIWSRHV